MIDCKGNTLHVGDEVVYIFKTYCTAELRTGIISGFKNGCAVIGESIVAKKVKKQSIMLLKRKNENIKSD